MNKKSLGALLLSAALLVGGTGATFAYFTDTQKTDVQSVTMGNVHIAFTPASGNANWNVIERNCPNLLEALKVEPLSILKDFPDNGYDELVKADRNNISNVAPGDVLCKAFTLQNTGSLDAKVRFSLDDLSINNVAQAQNILPGGNIDFKAYTLNADGTPGNEVKLVVDADHNYILDAKTHESMMVYARVYIDASMDNAGMDKNFKFDVKAEATQWNNPGWTQTGAN